MENKNIEIPIPHTEVKLRVNAIIIEEKERECREEDVNYVVIQDNGEPLKWSDDNKVIIYGGIVDAENDVREGDKIVTLGEYAKSIGVDWRTLI